MQNRCIQCKRICKKWGEKNNARYTTKMVIFNGGHIILVVALKAMVEENW